eukprot:3477497-Pleurochrysis_carterae.AAC.2
MTVAAVAKMQAEARLTGTAGRPCAGGRRERQADGAFVRSHAPRLRRRAHSGATRSPLNSSKLACGEQPIDHCRVFLSVSASAISLLSTA